MKTLREILALKDEIANLVKNFGFLQDEIKFYYGNVRDEHVLTLIIQENRIQKKSLHSLTYLQAKLIHLTNCEIHLIDYETINELYKDFFISSSTSFNEKELKILYGEQFEAVIFNEYVYSNNLYSLILSQANKFLLNIG